ncbi:MAG: PLP-dependent aspartate aminotransferase family protein [Candidatus Korobacteraceae bacterium]
MKSLGVNSKMVHAGYETDSSGSVNVPIYQTSTFAFRNVAEAEAVFSGAQDGFMYSRMGNPTVRALEDSVAELENGCGGIATSSGMGAVCTVYLALLSSGAHVVSTASVYGPTRGLMEKDFSRFGVESTYVDTCDLAQVEDAVRPNTRLLYIETPANPTMQVTDIEAVAAIAHRRGCLLVVDNTFASPYLQRPLDLGADVVLHSVTKFINGHSDVVGGILVAKEMDVHNRLHRMMVISGCNMDPHQAFLVYRGLKTLGIRVERAQKSALEIARWLEQQQEVEVVRYIGLESHPQYALAKRQMKGPGSMISFELAGGMEGARLFLNKVRLAALAVSLGGVESLIEHPASMSHASMSPNDRRLAGFSDGLIRYSVGIEDVEDLIADLRQALDAVSAGLMARNYLLGREALVSNGALAND